MNLTHTIRDLMELKGSGDFQSTDGQFTTNVDQPDLAKKEKKPGKTMTNPDDQSGAKYQMEEVELEESKLDKSIYNVNVHYTAPEKNYTKTHRVTVSRGDDEDARITAAVSKHLGDEPHKIVGKTKGQFNRAKPNLNKGIEESTEYHTHGYLSAEVEPGSNDKNEVKQLHKSVAEIVNQHGGKIHDIDPVRNGGVTMHVSGPKTMHSQIKKVTDDYEHIGANHEIDLKEGPVSNGSQLDQYLTSLGWNPDTISFSKKQHYAQSDAFKHWIQTHFRESVDESAPKKVLSDKLKQILDRTKPSGPSSQSPEWHAARKKRLQSKPELKESDEVSHLISAREIIGRAKGDEGNNQEYLDFLKHLRDKFGKDYSTKIHQSASKFTEEVELEEGLKVGDDVAAQVNSASTVFGKVHRVGQTGVHIIVRGQKEPEFYPHKSVYPSSEYEKRNPNPYEKPQKNLKEEELDEAKSGYTIYHPTYSSAVQHAHEHLKKKGLEISDDNWFHHVNSGPKKPGEGQTNRLDIPLHKDGVETKKHAHIQVYNRGNDVKNAYELNLYHESVNEDKYQDAQAATQTTGMEVENSNSNLDRKREMSKSARLIKSLYKHHKMAEDMYDHEKEDKSVKGFKKPKIDKNDGTGESFEDDKTEAKITISGGKTETNKPRDTIEVDPVLKKRLSQQQTMNSKTDK